jgi:hypothetical protein
MIRSTPKRLFKTLFTYTVFAVAMAYVETAVVVYLRLLYYPDGFVFPMKTIPMQVAIVELGREAATLIILWFVARMSGRDFKERFALFALTFAVWDIFYYFWLKVLINWPIGWTDWDILFLIPAPWIAPWLAPALVSLGLICGALLVLIYPERFSQKIFSLCQWLVLFAATALILTSFFTETPSVLNGGIPQHYAWWLFISGYLLGWVVVLRKFFTAKLVINAK